MYKKRGKPYVSLLLHLHFDVMSYAGCIDSVGQASAQVPQSVQISASIT